MQIVKFLTKEPAAAGASGNEATPTAQASGSLPPCDTARGAQFTERDIIQVLIESAGNLLDTAKALGCSRRQIAGRRDNAPLLR
jgi:hypothetical protein